MRHYNTLIWYQNAVNLILSKELNFKNFMEEDAPRHPYRRGVNRLSD